MPKVTVGWTVTDMGLLKSRVKVKGPILIGLSGSVANPCKKPGAEPIGA